MLLDLPQEIIKQDPVTELTRLLKKTLPMGRSMSPTANSVKKLKEDFTSLVNNARSLGLGNREIIELVQDIVESK